MRLYLNYPIEKLTETPGARVVHFNIFGSSRLKVQMRLIPSPDQHLPGLEVTAELDGREKTLEPRFTQEGHLEYEVRGSQKITIRQPGERKSKRRKP